MQIVTMERRKRRLDGRRLYLGLVTVVARNRGFKTEVRSICGGQADKVKVSVYRDRKIRTIDQSRLKKSNKYFIDTCPRLCYCQSNFITKLVESKVSKYVDFKALDRTWILYGDADELHSVPGNRGDIFTSEQYDLFTKNRIVKFLKFAQNPTAPEQSAIYVKAQTQPISQFLSSEPFSLSSNVVSTIIHAIGMTYRKSQPTLDVITRIERHLQSYGIYGDFPVLVPMYGGGGELAQSFCRAAAVHGATFALKTVVNTVEYGIDSITLFLDKDAPLTSVRTQWLVAPRQEEDLTPPSQILFRKTIVVDQPLTKLFSTAACDASLLILTGENSDISVECILRGSGSGECPVGQCPWNHLCLKVLIYTGIIYFSSPESQERLQDALKQLLRVVSVPTSSIILELDYQHALIGQSNITDLSKRQVCIPSPAPFVIDYDDVLQQAQTMFNQIYHGEPFLQGSSQEDEDEEPDQVL